MRTIILLSLLLCVLSARPSFAGVDSGKLVAAARKQIGQTVSYDPAYRKLDYPGGDVPKETGVCSDVIIRALRDQGIDLQKELHEDMTREFSAYPQKWGLKKPDRNIDHRRVPNLMAYFKRKGYSLALSEKQEKFAPGDIVTWNLDGGLTHIGIVSDRKSAKGVPLVIHNIGSGAQEEDVLFKFKITGHYRVK